MGVMVLGSKIQQVTKEQIPSWALGSLERSKKPSTVVSPIGHVFKPLPSSGFSWPPLGNYMPMPIGGIKYPTSGQTSGSSGVAGMVWTNPKSSFVPMKSSGWYPERPRNPYVKSTSSYKGVR